MYMQKKSPRLIRLEVEADLARNRQIKKELNQRKKAGERPPSYWEKPPFKSQEYREAVCLGWIGEEEHLADRQAFLNRQKRALETTWRIKGPLPRSKRPHPIQGSQYSREMSTEAARSQRLTPNAKALLQIIYAYSGKRGWWSVTKTFLALSMGVSSKSVQRYLSQLVEEGFLLSDIEQVEKTGMVKGLFIRLTEKVFPRHKLKYFQATLGKLDRTKLSLNNHYMVKSIIKYSRHEWKFMCTNPFLFEKVKFNFT